MRLAGVEQGREPETAVTERGSTRILKAAVVAASNGLLGRSISNSARQHQVSTERVVSPRDSVAGTLNPPSSVPVSSQAARVSKFTHHPWKMRQRVERGEAPVSKQPVDVELNPIQTWGVGEVAVATGLSLRQLQWWDERGYLSPPQVLHQRRYSKVHVECAFILQRLRDLGFNPKPASKLIPTLHRMLRKDALGAVIDHGKGSIISFTDRNWLLSRMRLSTWCAVVDFDEVRAAIKKLPAPQFAALRAESRPTPAPSESRVGA